MAQTARPCVAAGRQLLSACLVVTGVLMLILGLALPCAPAQRAWAETSIDVTVAVDVSKVDPVDPDPPLLHTAKVLVLDVSGRPVEGAKVTVAGGSSSQFTGSDGTVSVSGLEQGSTYAVIVSKAGYDTSSGTYACRGIANEVWPLVLRLHEDTPIEPSPRPEPGSDTSSGGSGNPGGGTSNPYITVDSKAPATDSPATDESSEAAGAARDASLSSGQKDASGKKDDGKSEGHSTAGQDSDGQTVGFPWWILLLLVAVAFMLWLFLVWKRHKKDKGMDVEDGLEGIAPSVPVSSEAVEANVRPAIPNASGSTVAAEGSFPAPAETPPTVSELASESASAEAPLGAAVRSVHARRSRAQVQRGLKNRGKSKRKGGRR